MNFLYYIGPVAWTTHLLTNMGSVPVVSKAICYSGGFFFALGWWMIIAGIILSNNFIIVGLFNSTISQLIAGVPTVLTLLSILLTRVPSSAAMSSGDEWGVDNSSQRIILFSIVAGMIIAIVASWGIWGFYHRELEGQLAVLLPPIGTTLVGLSVLIVKFARPSSD